MRSLRVILVMIEPPLPFGNAAARWYYVLIKQLVAKGHRVTALAACGKPQEIDQVGEHFDPTLFDLRLHEIRPRRGVAAKLDSLRRPYSYMFSEAFVKDLDSVLAEGFDVLHLDQLSCGWVGLRHAERAMINVHFLYSIDLEWAGVGRFEMWQMRRAERCLLRGYERIVTLSDRLAEGIRQINPRAQVAVVPLGIDASLYDYIPDDRRTDEPVIGVIGNMGWYPSRSAAIRLLTRLWPEIRRRVPAARVQIVGWQAKSALGEFLGSPGVEIVEDVPDIRPYFARMGVLLYAPGRGSGMKVKVLEAFGFGVPVVTTPEGVEGIPALDGVHAGVVEDDSGLVDRTVELLRNASRQDRQRRAARELLERHCSPRRTVDAIEEVYDSIINRRFEK